MNVLARYLASPMPRRSRPSLDRVIAVLDDHPEGLTRQQLAKELRLTYVGVVDVLARAERSGWVRSSLQSQAGHRSVLVYVARVPETVDEGGVGSTPRGGGAGVGTLSVRARAPGSKISGSGSGEGG